VQKSFLIVIKGIALCKQYQENYDMSGWMVFQSRFIPGTTVTATEVDLLSVKLDGS